MSVTVADLCDAYPDRLEVCEISFRDFGRPIFFSGIIATAKVFEDNSLVRRALEEPGRGQVLVVDGGGSLRCALLGDRLARLALENGWAGIVVYGAIRDSAVLATLPLPVKALGTHPQKSFKKDQGSRDIPLRIGGVSILPGHFLYADPDGVAVSAAKLV